MGKASRRKQKSLEGKWDKLPVLEEKAISSPPFARYGLPIVFLLITMTALLIYSNTFSSPFHFDDESKIVGNYKLKDLANLWPPSGLRYIGYLSFALNYYFGQLDVFGYHLVNITIHIINGLLVWWLVLLTFKTPLMEESNGFSRLKYFIALVSALIFISHPVQTQAVTYIVQRFTSLATLFYLLALVLYIKGRLLNQSTKNISQNSDQKERNINSIKSVLYYLASVISAVLAMETKEISFTLPFIIVLYEITFFSTSNPGLRTPNLKRLYLLVPFLITLLIIPLSLLKADKPLGDIIGELREAAQETEQIPRGVYLLTQFKVIVTYIRLLFLPINQNLDYDYPIYHSLNLQVFFSLLFLLLIFGIAVYLFYVSHSRYRGLRIIAFGIFWFFITLSVESSIIPIRDVINEHRLYLPSVGAVLAFVSTVFYVFDYTKLARSSLLATCLLLLVTAVPLGIAAYNRNFVWNDKAALWEDVVRKSPNKYRGYNNLGLVYYNQRRLEEAIKEYSNALKLKPDDPDVYINLGNAYAKQGRSKEAIKEYSNALKLKPDDPVAHNSLGNANANQGHLDEAIKEYTNALKLKPDYPEAHYNLGLVYYNQGHLEEAIKEYSTALKLKPDYPDAYTNLGLVYYNQGRLEDAILEYINALKLKPDLPEAHHNLGIVYYNRGQIDDAIKEYTTALKLKPDFPEAHLYLGNSYKLKGLQDEARKQFEMALKLRPDFTEAQAALKSFGIGSQSTHVETK